MSTFEMRDGTRVHSASVLHCPVCEMTLRVERRGGNWFAWCPNGPWGNGCSGMASFGETRQAAQDAVIAAFETL